MTLIRFGLGFAMLCATAAQAQVTFTKIPITGGIPHGITAGPDGNLWFTNNGQATGPLAVRIGRITTSGELAFFPCLECPVPSGAGYQGWSITVGPDGKLWFPETRGRFIGKLDPFTGQLTEISNTHHNQGAHTEIITTPDGTVWYSGFRTLERIHPPGITLPSGVPLDGEARGMAVGADGNVWLAKSNNGGIAKVTSAGVDAIYNVTWDGCSFSGCGTDTFRLDAGPDGRIWVPHTSGLWAFTTAGSPSRFPWLPDPELSVGSTNSKAFMAHITAGPDGKLWGAAQGYGSLRLVSADTEGNFNIYNYPPVAPRTPSDITYLPSDIATGPDGCLYITVNAPPTIFRACPSGPRVTTISTTNPDGPYVTGQQVVILVTFDQPAIVSGNPRLALNSGGEAVYTSGSGTNVLTFTYTIGAGDFTARLDGATAVPHLLTHLPGRAMSIRLHGGTIRDADSNSAILLLPVAPTEGALALNHTIAINPPDSTPPASAISIPPANAHGWYNTDVFVSITATDMGGSGVKEIHYNLNGGPEVIVPGSTAQFVISTEGATNIAYFAKDNIGNTESAGNAVVQLDKTPPSVAFGAASPDANAAGWNNTDVSVPFTATDALSGVDTAGTTAGPLLLSAEGPVVTDVVTVLDKAGNMATFASPVFRIDKTQPTITGSQSPAANVEGWNNTPVTVSFLCSDALSGLAPGSPPANVVLSGDGESQSAAGACQDNAGNSASVAVEGINIDQTPPTATATAAPLPNAHGWNNSDVTVTFACADSGSGPGTTPAPVVISAEGAGQSASGSCTDQAGNPSGVVAKSGINIDKTAPTVAFDLPSPAANPAGWNNTNVSIAFTPSDSLSGLDNVTPASPLLLVAEGASVGASVTLVDRAGNTAVIPSPAVKIDQTAPLLVGSRSPAPNAAGWNNASVTVSFTCSDALSGAAPVMPGGPVVVSSEGANQSVAGTCQDAAGNSAAAVVGGINIDLTAPEVSNLAADPSAVPLNTGFTVKATLSDALSGAASAEYSIDGGDYAALSLASGIWSAAVEPAPVGVHSLCARGVDGAGNTSDPYCVLFAVFDPEGGHVTGGGWIVSPTGAYAANPGLTGKAHFGFTSKYKNGANVPSGNTEFQFQAGNLNFKSTAYEWLVVAGARAQFKGSGTINGAGDYRFMLTAIDGQKPGGGGADRFRIKIWATNPDGSDGGIVYDNKMGSSDTGNDATELGGGSIVIHH